MIPPSNHSDIHDLIINLIGGILVALLDRMIIYLGNFFKNYRFKKIFGKEINLFNVVYGRMVLKPQYLTQDPFPYVKPNINGQFSVSNPVSFTETKSAKYLSESFSKCTGKSPTLISDDEIIHKIDISYCSFGGFNNTKTIYILQNTQNYFYHFSLESGEIVNKKNRNNTYSGNKNYDYAVIVKIKNKLFPNRTQICVAGIGEWGTSGGAWFLANKWKEILKKAGNKEFGAVIKVMKGSDESAELVEIMT